MGACPICSKPPAAEYRPFCSKRCADLDLHRWLTGRYAITGLTPDGETAEGSGAGDTGDEAD